VLSSHALFHAMRYGPTASIVDPVISGSLILEME